MGERKKGKAKRRKIDKTKNRVEIRLEREIAPREIAHYHFCGKYFIFVLLKKNIVYTFYHL